MIIDSRVHPGRSLYRTELKIYDLLKSMERLHIDKSVIHPVKPAGYRFEPENDWIFALTEKYPDRFIPFGRIDPWREENALNEMARIFQMGMKGLFLHPLEENYPLTSDILNPIMDIMEKVGRPVMIAGGHAGVSHPRQIEYMARRFPKVTFIATSAGQFNISGLLLFDAEEMLKKCDNVFMETSGIYRRDFIESMCGKIGPARILFASGTPQFHQEMELMRITTAEMPEEHKNMILGENISRILNLDR